MKYFLNHSSVVLSGTSFDHTWKLCDMYIKFLKLNEKIHYRQQLKGIIGTTDRVKSLYCWSYELKFISWNYSEGDWQMSFSL